MRRGGRGGEGGSGAGAPRGRGAPCLPFGVASVTHPPTHTPALRAGIPSAAAPVPPLGGGTPAAALHPFPETAFVRSPRRGGTAGSIPSEELRGAPFPLPLCRRRAARGAEGPAVGPRGGSEGAGKGGGGKARK